MPAFLAGPIARIRSVLSTISLGQKVVIGLLAAGLLLGGFYFYSWITTPTQAPLFSNLASTDASAIVEELNAEGVAYDLADGLAKVQALNDTSDSMAAKAATGDLKDVHDYMIASTEASLATELTVAVRNKAIESFNEIMRMPV